jgi:hypothetical protein
MCTPSSRRMQTASGVEALIGSPFGPVGNRSGSVLRRRNTKGALKLRLRLRPVPPRDLALGARGVEWPHLGGVRKHGCRRVTHTPQTRCVPHAHTRLTRCATAHARPSLRHGGHRRALPASRSSCARPTAASSPRLTSGTPRCSQQGCTAPFLLRFRNCNTRNQCKECHLSCDLLPQVGRVMDCAAPLGSVVTQTSR